MRILYLAPALIWPPHTGGTRRSAAILERLARNHQVYLFALEGDGGSLDATIAAELEGVRTFPYPLTASQSSFAFYRNLLVDPLPKSVRQAVSGQALAAAAAFARECAPDAIIAEPIEMQPYLHACARAVPSARTMLGWIDVVWLKIARETLHARGFVNRVHAHRERTRMARLERQSARSVDVRTCVSEVDKEQLEARTGRPFVLAPNGVDATWFAPRSGQINQHQALFVGPLSFEPNRDGVTWFAERVLPRLNNVSLTVAGEPSGFVAPRGVGLAGRVADVRSVMAHAGVVVVPLRSGSGTRLKILEALAMEKAVVSTSIGAEGLDVRDEEHVLIADEPDAFADAVTRVVSDPGLRVRLGKNGRALVEQRYQWETAVKAIEDALSAQACEASA